MYSSNIRWRSVVWNLVCLGLVVTLVGGLTGCVSNARLARHKAKNKAVDNYVFKSDLDSSWSEVRSYFQERGYSIESDEGHQLETGWKVQSGAMGKDRTRYTVTATETDSGWKLEVTEDSESFVAPEGEWSGAVTSSTDRATEFRLIKRIEPDGAEKINQKAEKAAKKAKQGEGS